MADRKNAPKAKVSVVDFARAWGKSMYPALLTGNLIAITNFPPPPFLPAIFPPVLLYCAYLNMTGYRYDSAGIGGAWSALYLLLARKREYPSWERYRVYGLLRGVTLGTCAMNVVGGGLVYFTEKRVVERNLLKELVEKGKSLIE